MCNRKWIQIVTAVLKTSKGKTKVKKEAEQVVEEGTNQ